MSVLGEHRQERGVASKNLGSCWQRGLRVGLTRKQGGATCRQRKRIAAAINLVPESWSRYHSRIFVCISKCRLMCSIYQVVQGLLSGSNIRCEASST